MRSDNTQKIGKLIKQFAQDHATVTMALLGRWPDIYIDDRPKQVTVYFNMLLREMKSFAEEHNITLTPEIRGKLLLETLLNSVGIFLGDPKSNNYRETYQFQRDRLLSRVEQIINLILKQQNERRMFLAAIPSLDIPQIMRPVEIVWGQHGAHFKQGTVSL